VPDIDIVWLGSLDARVNMNFDNGMFGEEPEWLAAREKFFTVLDKHDKPYGGFAFANPPWGSVETVKQAKKRMSFMTVSSDVSHLMGMATDLQEAKELTKLS
jgi:4-hydroxy-2-oxoheptanedioate aldolase